jgi:ABC-2 type transport system permease protein
MTGILVRKLLRDVVKPLALTALLLGLYQLLWVKITARILGEMAPFFNELAGLGGMNQHDLEQQVFKGPGQIIRSLIGGEHLSLDHATDMLSIGYVHPVMLLMFCVWAIGRGASAVAGEIDRGTMELLLAQPLARFKLILAHFLVDVLTIPVLCLSLWAGTSIGWLIIGPIKPEAPDFKLPDMTHNFELGPLKYSVKAPFPVPPETEEQQEARLHVSLPEFLPALPMMGGLIFAVSGYTIWLSARGRFRMRVLMLAIGVTVVQFLINLLGQMWDFVAPLRPLTVFYYYQPQQVILGHGGWVPLGEWDGRPACLVPALGVLLAVGFVGYGMALWTFSHRDIPAPL